MASKRRLRRRSCEIKYTHANQTEAWREVGRLRHVIDADGVWRAYRCRFCGQWHVGRPKARQLQVIKDRRS